MNFLHWYYFTAWREIFKAWTAFIRFWWYFFSIPWLLGTLIAPWRRDVTSYGRGFDFARFGRVLANNLISRVIGLMVRLVAIVTWFFIEILTILGGAAWIAAWPLFLPLALIGLFRGSVGVLQGYTITGGLLALVCFLSGWALVRGFRHRRAWEITQLSEEDTVSKAPDLWGCVLQRLGYEGDPENFLPNREKLLAAQNLDEEDFTRVFLFEQGRAQAREYARRFWEPDNLFSVAPLGRSWAYGYTVNLDKVGTELGSMHGALQSEPTMHREEFQQIESILARSRGNNVLIVGEPGVGRTVVVEDFARLLHQGRVANSLSHKRLIELNREGTINPSRIYRANPERSERVRAPNADVLGHVLAEAEYAGNVILVLPMLEHYAGHADILVPYLKSSHIQIIAITSYAQLHEILERSPELLGHFEKVEIKEPDAAETLQRVFGELEPFESRYRVFVPYPVLKVLIEETDRYIQDTPFPKKAFDLLDRAMSTAASEGETTLTRRVVEAVLAQKTEIPVARPGEEERDLLVHLEEKMHERLIGQEEAVKQIADALRRARVDIGARTRPIGSFLFLGPTGVGKTEAAKALARLYYGREERMIRLDMSEFQEVESIARLIGDIRSNTPGILTTAIRENPASLVLLDETEKAHPDILNLFLQVIDDARLTDAWGRTVKFTSACIIATSNAGAEHIREVVKNGQDLSQSREAILEELQARGVFRPEFLNRFDGVILFRPLSESELEKIAFLLLSQLAARLKEQHITFIPTPELAREVAVRDYQPEFGARALRRTIQDLVESALAKRILAGTLQKGATLEPRSLKEIAIE